MPKALRRLWARLRGTQAPLDVEKDWKTVGKTFRATDALGGEGPSYVRPMDDGRPRH
jgi:hypothetical protein